MSQIYSLIFLVIIIFSYPTYAQKVITRLKTEKSKITTPEIPPIMDGFKLTQSSQKFGQFVCYITSYALKIKSQNLCVIVKYPDYELHFINYDSHQICKLTLKEFLSKKSYLRSSYREQGDLVFEKQNKKVKISDFSAEEFKCYIKQKGVKKTLASQFDSINSKIFNKKLMSTFCQLVDLPPNCGLPVQYWTIDIVNGKLKDNYLLKTKSIEKVKISKKEFALPQNFKPTKSYMELILGDTLETPDENTKTLFQQE